MINESKTFCILPWLHVASTSFGSYRVCCNSTPGVNQILRPDGVSYKLADDDIAEVWNSDFYKDLRRQFIDNQKPAMCTRCFREEDSGVTSARQSYNQQFSQYLPRILESADQDGTADIMIKYLDIRLGNVCNLKCRMCNPWASNQWVKEWNAVSTADDQIDNITNLLHIDWPENPKVWEHLFAVIPEIDEIYLTGGEPLLIKQQFNFLQRLIDNDRAKDIVIKYNTNMTSIPDEAKILWPHFKKVKLNASIDGIGVVDEIIRFPSKWEKIQANVDNVYSLSKSYSNLAFNVHCTVQVMNIYYLLPLLDWLENYDIIPYMNILNHPENLNIRILPKDQKNIVLDQFEDWLSVDIVRGKRHQQNFDKISKYMLAEDWSHLISDFVKWTISVDKIRGHDSFELLPKLKALL